MDIRKIKSVGLDDFAIKKRHRYGTVLVNQEDHQIFDLIESRDKEDVIDLLKRYPYIEKVTRDGSLIYAAAISEALPSAIQISDRFHLFKNLSDALKDDLSLILPGYVSAVNESEDGLHEKLSLTKKELNELERHHKKCELVKLVRQRYEECGKINVVQKEFDMTYRTVKKYLANDPVLVKYEKVSSLTPYFETIYNSVINGESSYKTFDKIKTLGYSGSYSNMSRYIRLKKKKRLFSKNGTVPRKYIIKLLYNKGIYDLPIISEWQDAILSFLKRSKYVNSILMIATEFRIAMFSGNPQQLHNWIEKAIKFPELKKLQSFLNGTINDIKAAENAVIYSESNGVVEGAVCKIKKTKRVLFGRCKFDLLKQKILL